MAEDSAQDKDLPASQKRKQQAREKGQVARSRDLTSSLLLLGMAAVVYVAGGWFFDMGRELLHTGLTVSAAASQDPTAMLQAAGKVMVIGLMVLVPVLAFTFVASAAGGVAMGGWVFSTEALAPDFSRLDPVSGLQRMFSIHGLGELGKALLKAVVIAVIGGIVLWNQRGALLGLLQVEPDLAQIQLGQITAHAFLWMAAGTLLVAAVDVPWQLFQMNKKLKMSRQDLQDEMRESEGNPQIKQKMRALQRERARQRMMAAVPKADVVVTNPTHYAVALAYEEGRNRAPVVLALGADLVAARIREVAAEHGVPVIEAPPLARALFHHAELEQEIPVALYNAVALLLAYVFQLRAAPQIAQAPDDWAIPADFAVNE
ncbi:flagellar biosynthesis protein FlhB [Thiomonas intermedia]|uniref:flagellar biosynthesis protein FlhB n=1 Tax=Thiomonas intermedia TaxID=926 RepID=UPI0009A4DC09|nr:flagellar biosynthesis protein FlhB [Thiomonas intermedia]